MRMPPSTGLHCASLPCWCPSYAAIWSWAVSLQVHLSAPILLRYWHPELDLLMPGHLTQSLAFSWQPAPTCWCSSYPTLAPTPCSELLQPSPQTLTTILLCPSQSLQHWLVQEGKGKKVEGAVIILTILYFPSCFGNHGAMLGKTNILILPLVLPHTSFLTCTINYVHYFISSKLYFGQLPPVLCGKCRACVNKWGKPNSRKRGTCVLLSYISPGLKAVRIRVKLKILISDIMQTKIPVK